MTALTVPEATALLGQLNDWGMDASFKKISKVFRFKDFAGAMLFANTIAVIAEQEGHHPDLAIAWGKVGVTLSTHAVQGLMENDFILAAKIDAIAV